MKARFKTWVLAVAFLSIFAVGTSAIAQENSNTKSTTGSATQSTQSTTTSTNKSTEPVQTTVTKTTGVDPVWLVAGAIGLVAILAIIIMATRGRSHDTATSTVVHDRETVIKK